MRTANRRLFLRALGAVAVGGAAGTTQLGIGVVRSQSIGAPQTEWQNTTRGASGGAMLEDIIQTNDGGFLVAGSGRTAGTGDPASQGLLLKIKPDGSRDWLNSYGGAGGNRLIGVTQASDGYVAAGAAGITNENTDNGWVIKTDSSGSLQWEVETTGTEQPPNTDDQFRGVIQSPDDGYIAHGAVMREGNHSGWLLKLSSDGAIEWEQRQEGILWGYEQLIESNNGGYLAVGGSSDGSENYPGWLGKFTTDGTLNWMRTYAVSDNSQGHGLSTLVENDDGSLILGGYVNENLYEDFGLVIKTGPNGEIQWHQLYGDAGDHRISSLTPATTGQGYVLTGTKSDLSTDSNAAGWLFRIGPEGEKYWERTYGDEETPERFNSIATGADGGYAMVGVQERDQSVWGFLLKTGIEETPTPTETEMRTPNENEGFENQTASDSNQLPLVPLALGAIGLGGGGWVLSVASTLDLLVVLGFNFNWVEPT